MTVKLTDLTPAEQGGAVISALTKGTTFTMGGKQYTCTSIGKKQIRIKTKDKPLTIEIYPAGYFGNHRTENFFRDLEGELMVDHINALNPFHEKSDVYKLAMQTIRKEKTGQ